ncbi:MAG TPA: DUF1761 domain-containing protein [Gammaproteobacteria bacterium]|jgi:hypothetical protein|nr:DUF1761 domain-containing protein [Gammaproteobacteria bacterium]
MNYLGIFLAAAAMFALGSVWYSPVLFAKVWVRESGGDPAYKPTGKEMGRTFGGTFLLLLVSAAVLDWVMQNSAATGEGLSHGLTVGFLGAVIAVAMTGINYLFERKSLKLFLINSGYNVIGFCIMGAVLALA